MLFQYTTLSPGSIRLVTYDPSSTPDNISLKLHHQENYTSDSVKYTVLSYPHTNDPTTKPLTLHGRTRLVPTPVHNALSAILRQQQRGSSNNDNNNASDRRFWIDAVCVNQRDEVEKAEHARQLSRIYGSAEKVMVWCEEADEDERCVSVIAAAFKLIEEVAVVAGQGYRQQQQLRARLQRGCCDDDDAAREGLQRLGAILADVEISAGYCRQEVKKVELLCREYCCDLESFNACKALSGLSGRDSKSICEDERAAL